MDKETVTINNEIFRSLAASYERCNIIERMLDRGMIITDSLLRAILDIEVPEDELSI